MSDTLNPRVCETHEQDESKSTWWNRTRNPRLFDRLCYVLCSFVWASCVVWCRMFRRDQRLQWFPFSNYSQSQSRKTILNAKEHLNLNNFSANVLIARLEWHNRSMKASVRVTCTQWCVYYRGYVCAYMWYWQCVCVFTSLGELYLLERSLHVLAEWPQRSWAYKSPACQHVHNSPHSNDPDTFSFFISPVIMPGWGEKEKSYDNWKAWHTCTSVKGIVHPEMNRTFPLLRSIK